MRTREPGSDIKRGPGGGPSRGARRMSNSTLFCEKLGGAARACAGNHTIIIYI